MGVLVGLLTAGCGSSSSNASSRSATEASTTHAASGWTGFGAKLADWETAHPKGTEGCTQGCYGTKVQTGPNESSYEFTVLSSGGAENRVDGYTQALPEGTGVVAAKEAVLKLLPSDTHPQEFWITRQNGSCANWNLKSATLARWLADPKIGDPQGIVGVVFSTPNANGEGEYNPNKVSFANVGVGPERHGISC
jgi:hypothetical protein